MVWKENSDSAILLVPAKVALLSHALDLLLGFRP
jgi:hypothetical protein